MRPRAHTTPIGNDETMAVSRRYNSKIAHQTSTPNDKKKIPAQLHFRLILSYFFFDSCFVTRYHLLCRRLFFNHYLNYKYSRFLQRFFFCLVFSFGGCLFFECNETCGKSYIVCFSALCLHPFGHMFVERLMKCSLIIIH